MVTSDFELAVPLTHLAVSLTGAWHLKCSIKISLHLLSVPFSFMSPCTFFFITFPILTRNTFEFQLGIVAVWPLLIQVQNHGQVTKMDCRHTRIRSPSQRKNGPIVYVQVQNKIGQRTVNVAASDVFVFVFCVRCQPPSPANPPLAENECFYAFAEWKGSNIPASRGLLCRTIAMSSPTECTRCTDGSWEFDI